MKETSHTSCRIKVPRVTHETGSFHCFPQGSEGPSHSDPEPEVTRKLSLPWSQNPHSISAPRAALFFNSYLTLSIWQHHHSSYSLLLMDIKLFLTLGYWDSAEGITFPCVTLLRGEIATGNGTANLDSMRVLICVTVLPNFPSSHGSK